MPEVEGQLALLQETRSYGPVTVTFNRFGRELEATITVPEGYVANVTVRADVFRLGLPPRETKTVTYSFGPGTHTIVLSASELGGLFGRFEVIASPQHVGPGKEEEYLKEITKAFQEQTKAITEAIKSMQESISSIQESINQQIQYLAQLMQTGQQPSPEETETIEKLVEQYTESMQLLQQQIAMLQEEILRLEQQPKTPEHSKEIEELRQQIQQYQQQIAQLQEQIHKLQEELSKAKAPKPTPAPPTAPTPTKAPPKSQPVPTPPVTKPTKPPEAPPVPAAPKEKIRGKLEVRGTATETKYPDRLPGTFYAKGWVRVINPNNMSKTFSFNPFAQATVSTGPHEVTWVNVGRNYRIYVNGKFVGSKYTDTVPAKSEKQYTIELYVDIPLNEAMKSLQYGISVDYQYEYWDEREHRWRKKWDHLIAWAVYVTESELKQIIEKSKGKKVTTPTTTKKVTKTPTTTPTPAKFVITSAPNKVEVEQGQNVKITVSIKNVGGSEGEGLVTLLDEHGIAAAVKEFRLAPSKETTITLVAPVSTPGTFRWQIVVTDKQAKQVYERRYVTVVVKPKPRATTTKVTTTAKTTTAKAPSITGFLRCEITLLDPIHRKAIVRVCNYTNVPANVTIHVETIRTPIPGGGPRPPRPTAPVMARLFGRIIANIFGAVTPTGYGGAGKEYGPIPPGKCRDIAVTLPVEAPGKYLLVVHGRAGDKECEVRREFEIKPVKKVTPKTRPPVQPVTTAPPPAGPRKEKGAGGELSCNITSYNSHVHLEVKNTTLIDADVKYEVYKDNNRIYRGYATAPATNIWSETIDLKNVAKNAGLIDVYGRYKVVLEASNSLKRCSASKIVELKKPVMGGGPRPVPAPGGALMTQKGGEVRARKGHLY